MQEGLAAQMAPESGLAGQRRKSSTSHMSSPRSFLGPGPDYIPPSSAFFFAPGVRKQPLLHFLPSRESADKLMLRYWLACHPVARIIHRPSFELQFINFWKELSVGREPPNSFAALVFAAMFSAVLSIPDENILAEFGVSKAELSENFREGTELALQRANFVRTAKVETLQAFVLYLVSLSFYLLTPCLL
jgi:hypothetical protein